MPCVTCSHTMQHLNCAEPLFWCPRCGTVTSGASLHATYTPQLVESCRKFWPSIENLSDSVVADWHRLVADSIHPPEGRP